MPSIIDSKGLLTAYGLACGYQQKKEHHNIITRLYREHTTYVVSSFDHTRMVSLYWKAFPSTQLRDARKQFAHAWRQSQLLSPHTTKGTN